MLSVLSLLLVSATVAAAHRNNITLFDNLKRATSSKFSNYFAGQGACGWANSDSEFVVALTAQQWNNGANCGKEISISWQGKSTTAKIVDECMDCPWNGLDFSQGLFSFFVGDGNNEQVGIIYGEWSYVSAGGSGGESTTSTKNTPITTTSTQQKTTTTSTSTPTTSTTTSSTTSEAVSKSVAAASTSDPTSVSASAPASAKSSAPAASTTSATSPQNFEDFSQAILTLARLIVDAQGAT